MICTQAQIDALYKIYGTEYVAVANVTGNRGAYVTLTDCIETGFFPFTPATAETTYLVYITDVKNKGMSDDSGKLFKIELTFIWRFPNSGGASTISWNNPLTYCKEGALTFATYADLRFPQSGFKIKKGLDVAVQNYKGPKFYGVNFPTEDSEWNQSEFDLTMEENAASNLLYKLINTYRANSIFIEGGDNYYIFGEEQGDNTRFTVKMNDDTIKIKHKSFNAFEIGFDVVKI